MKKYITGILTLAAVLTITACGGDSATNKSTNPGAQANANASLLPANIFASEVPAEAKPLRDIRSDVKTGDTIVFTGYIGGRAWPFTDERAIFLVADSVNAPACTDGCRIPWDACCTPSDVIKTYSATVRILDEKGEVIRTSVDEQGPLVAGAEIAVTGIVSEASERVLIVDAFSIAALPKE